MSGEAFGIDRLGPIRLSVQDSTGLLESRSLITSYSEIAVFPETTEKLTHFPIRPIRTRAWPGEIVSRRTGTGMDYYNIRRFMPGDSARRINWRASAKHAEGSDEFLVNEYMAEVGAEVLIVVDIEGAPESALGRDSVVARSAKAAISIAERLLHDRNRVGLLTTGANPSRMAAGYGKRQFDRIALSLLRLKPGDTEIQSWVERSVNHFFPRASQIIFVSPLMDDQSIATAAEVTRSSGRDVIIVSPKPIGSAPKSREERIAKSLALMEREIDMAGLRRANALVIDWTSLASLEEVVEVHGRALARHAALAARSG